MRKSSSSVSWRFHFAADWKVFLGRNENERTSGANFQLVPQPCPRRPCLAAAAAWEECASLGQRVSPSSKHVLESWWKWRTGEGAWRKSWRKNGGRPRVGSKDSSGDLFFFRPVVKMNHPDEIKLTADACVNCVTLTGHDSNERGGWSLCSFFASISAQSWSVAKLASSVEPDAGLLLPVLPVLPVLPLAEGEPKSLPCLGEIFAWNWHRRLASVCLSGCIRGSTQS